VSNKALNEMTLQELGDILMESMTPPKKSYAHAMAQLELRDNAINELGRRDAEVAKLKDDLAFSHDMILRLERAFLKHLNGQPARNDFLAILAEAEARFAETDGGE
jgi:hypothetical protein